MHIQPGNRQPSMLVYCQTTQLAHTSQSQWARVSLRTARTNIEKGEDGAGCIAAADVEGEAGVHANWLVIRIKAAQHRNVAAANHRACWRVSRRHPCL